MGSTLKGHGGGNGPSPAQLRTAAAVLGQPIVRWLLGGDHCQPSALGKLGVSEALRPCTSRAAAGVAGVTLPPIPRQAELAKETDPPPKLQSAAAGLPTAATPSGRDAAGVSLAAEAVAAGVHLAHGSSAAGTGAGGDPGGSTLRSTQAASDAPHLGCSAAAPAAALAAPRHCAGAAAAGGAATSTRRAPAAAPAASPPAGGEELRRLASSTLPAPSRIGHGGLQAVPPSAGSEPSGARAGLQLVRRSISRCSWKAPMAV